MGRIPKGIVKFFPFFGIVLITGGLGEELGWRGFRLPRMQTRYNALIASLIVGVLHGLWHVPMFFIEGLTPYQEMAAAAGVGIAILGYTLFYVTPWSILYTFVYNNTKGSLLIVCVLHASEAWVLALWNISNPRSFIGLGAAMTIVSIIIVLVYGAENLSRTGKRISIVSM